MSHGGAYRTVLAKPGLLIYQVGLGEKHKHTTFKKLNTES